MTQHFPIFILVIFLVPFASAEATWCRAQSSNYNCTSLSYSNGKCQCKEGTVKVGDIRPPRGEEVSWQMRCRTGLLPDLTRANLSLGRVEYLILFECGLADSALSEYFRALKIEGLETLEIDMGDRSDRRPLTNESFDGLEELFPTLRRVTLERISNVGAGLFNPLPNLRNLSMHGWKNFANISGSFFRGLPNLEYLEIHGMPNLVALPEDLFRWNAELKVINLSSNGLQLLQSNLFRSLVNLEELVLNDNLIDTIPNDLFRTNVKLKILSWKEVKIFASWLTVFSQISIRGKK